MFLEISGGTCGKSQSFSIHYIDLSLIQILLMNPYPGPHSVIVMDNCCIHKSEAINVLIEDMHYMSSKALFFIY